MLSALTFKNQWISSIKENYREILAMLKFAKQCMYKCVRKKWDTRVVVSLVSFIRMKNLPREKVIPMGRFANQYKNML